MKKSTLLWVLAALVVGAAVGYLVPQKGAGPEMHAGMERKPLFYRNPMNPAVTSPVPAKDEMGMDYIPVYADTGPDEAAPAGTVRIDPVTVQNIGVRTSPVERRTLSRVIRASGRVDYDEERLARLHPKTEGWIEKLFVDATGQPVKQDSILLGIYSPQLVSTQEEYLLALQNEEVLRDSPFEDIRRGAKELLVSSRERLRLLDVPEHQIRELDQTRKVKKTLHIHSPFDGVVMQLGVREGQYVTPQTELYMIADLSKVWVYVDVFESDLPWVNVGDRAEMRLSGIPGRTFAGRIGYIYPFAEAATRTVKVRLEFDNPDRVLRPDLFADVTIYADRRVDALAVPSEAVVRSGAAEHVFVVRAPGKFEPRRVTLGITSDGWVQVLDGLREGEQVVTSAQFLIDSESKLREATAKMLEAGAAEHDMGDSPEDRMSGDGGAGMDGPTGHEMNGHDEMNAQDGHDMGGSPGHDMNGHKAHDMGPQNAGEPHLQHDAH